MKAFQDLIPDNNCWGCGPHNPHGLRIRSYWQDDIAICEFTPEPHHCAGPPQVVNGGIIASVIDCHAVGTAIAACYRAERREIGSGALIWCVTGELNVRYRRPAAIDQLMRVSARVSRHEGKKIELDCEAFSGGELCASASVLAIRVDNVWLQAQR
jgi:acyl-coenzyme A thioesterase PaaI-like protein